MLIVGGQVVAELFKDVLNQAEILPVIFDLTVHFRGIANRENNTERCTIV